MRRLKQLFRCKWFWLGLLMVLGGIFWFAVLPYRYTAVPLWGLAVTLGVYDGLSRLKHRHPKAARHLHRLFTVGLCLVLLLMAVTEGFVLSGFRGAKDAACPYVLVLGAGVNGTVPSRALTERLAAARDYLEAFPEAQCIVSGGQGGGEQITEALCMYTWLTEHGVPPERIWLEEKATSTQENLRFALELIEEKTGRRPAELAVVSSEYHLFRAGRMALSQGTTMLGVPACTYPLTQRIHYAFREIFGVWFFLLFGK